jgi:hypothetical protein
MITVLSWVCKDLQDAVWEDSLRHMDTAIVSSSVVVPGAFTRSGRAIPVCFSHISNTTHCSKHIACLIFSENQVRIHLYVQLYQSFSHCTQQVDCCALILLAVNMT